MKYISSINVFQIRVRALAGFIGLAAMSVFSNSATAQGFVDLELGVQNICALDADGRLECTTSRDPNVFLPADDGTRYTAIASGNAHTCGITSTGDISCFGRNLFGQLNVPETDATFVDISAGEAHTCAIDSEMNALCWGLNTNGQTDVPADAVNLTSIYTSPTGSCAINVAGETLCWTDDPRLNTSAASVGYVQLTIEGEAAGAPACGLTADGAIECWGGTRQFGEAPTGGPYTQLASNAVMFCGLQADGQLDCLSTPIGNADYDARALQVVAETELFPPLSTVDVSFSGFPGTSICGLGRDDGAVYCTPDYLPANTLPGATSSGLAAPTILDFVRYSGTAGELNWEPRLMDNINDVIAGYNVYRDGELIEFTGNRSSYFDDQLTVDFAHTYELAAVGVSGLEGPRSESISIPIGNGSSNENPGSNPEDSMDAFGLSESMTFERYGDNSLELFWVRPGTFFSGTTNVYRNGALIGTTAGTSFFDDTISAGVDYHYTIVIVDRNSNLQAVAFANVLVN